jgi:hypothetical protein
MVMVLAVGLGFGAGFGATATLGAGEQIDCTHRSAASADFGMLEICEELGQLTGLVTGLGETALTGLATVLGAGLGFGFGLAGAGTVTVFVIAFVVVEPGDLEDEPTQTVTDPDPILEPWLNPEDEDPPPEQAMAA